MNTIMSAAQQLGQRKSCAQPPAPSDRGLDRWEAFRLVRDCARELGLNDRDLTVLQAHLSVLPAGPISPGQILMSYMQVAAICERANGMDERTFRRGETRLAAAGLITRKLSPNGRRFPIRDPRSGDIVAAYGIDLTPLFDRLDDLSSLAEEVRIRAQEIANRKTALRERLARLDTFASSDLCETPDCIRDRVALCRTVLRRARLGHEDMDRIEGQLNELEAHHALTAVDDAMPPPAVDWTPRPAPDQPALDMSGDDGQTVRHIESQKKEIKEDHNQGPSTSEQSFKNIGTSWKMLKGLQRYFDAPPCNEGSGLRLLHCISSDIRFMPEMIAECLSVLGWEKTLLLANHLVIKGSLIRNLYCYVASILERARSGQPVLNGF